MFSKNEKLKMLSKNVFKKKIKKEFYAVEMFKFIYFLQNFLKNQNIPTRFNKKCFKKMKL